MYNVKELYNELKLLKGARVLLNEPMSRNTTIRIGGPADILVVPKDIEAVQETLRITKGIKKYIIGNGSNLIIPDRGLKGIVIKISGGLREMSIDGKYVTVGAGTLIQPLIRKLALHGLSGLEFASGVPAAVGGSIIMNMGAFGSEIGELIEYVDVINTAGEKTRLSRSDLRFKYRSSNITDSIIVSACIKMAYKEKRYVNRMIDEVIQKRKEIQPWSVPSAGSVFRNPKDVPAGKLIDMAGLKGLRVGGAEVSKKHANFIINLGDAKESDVKALARKVKNIVKEKFKVSLELELVDSKELTMLF